MNFVEFVARHGRSIVFACVSFAVAGLVSTFWLPVGLFPQVSFPRVVVDLDAGDRPADQMALLVTLPVEQEVRTIPGVLNVRSTSSRGTSQISIDFGWGRDMITSTILIDAAISRMLPTLPAGTTYAVRRMDPTVFPIISYGLVSEKHSQTVLKDLARFQLVPPLSAIEGVARVMVQGGETSEVEVLVDPNRLASYGIGLQEVADALGKANVLQAVGRMQDNHKLYLVVADHSINSKDAVGNVVVRVDGGTVVRIRDIATVQDDVVPQWIRVSEDGQPAVLLNVFEQPDGNAVQIAAEVRAKLAAFQLPAGVRLVNWYDQSELVTQSAASVRDAILIGLVLAAAVLLSFLRSWRMTLVAILVVPMTLATTVLLLHVLGMSFNIMTLGGIAAAVGLLIDDVIVMVEHIARRAGSSGKNDSNIVLAASGEFLRPLTGSTMATLIVFVPLGFLTGVTGAFSKALSITMAAALAISYVMTAFLVPVLVGRWVNFEKWKDPGERRGALSRGHGYVLDFLIKRPWLFLFALVPMLTVGWFAFNAVPTGFMPTVDEGGFVLDYYTPAGTSLTETSRETSQIDAILRSTPEVETFSKRLGTGLGGDLGESYHGDYFVRLKPDHRRSTPDVMASVLSEIESKVPGVEIELAQLMEDLIGDLTAVPQPIEIKLFAADPTILNAEARKVAAAVAKINGVVEVKSGVRLAGDALNVRIDDVRAGLEGMTSDEVSRALTTALTGTVATQLPQSEKAIGVRVRVPDATQMRETALADLPIRAPDGHVFPLNRVATFTPQSGQPEISRENLQPVVAVTGRIEGRGIGAAVADVRAALDAPGMLSSGVRYELGGLYQQQQIAFRGLAAVFATALIAEFLLLLFLYERLWLPVIIIGCSLLSTTAVFSALWLTGVDLNITALMGMTMIIGIGAEMAIFYVSEYTELSHRMPPHAALREASRNRLRPITMTTLAAILTLLPLALAIGQGAAIQQPLAISIIAGLLLQYPLVLLVMPALIALAERAQQKTHWGPLPKSEVRGA